MVIAEVKSLIDFNENGDRSSENQAVDPVAVADGGSLQEFSRNVRHAEAGSFCIVSRLPATVSP
jgi:hypothetical protein